MVIDCTAYSTYLNYVKSLLVKLVEHYHDEADILIFTSGDRLGIYNIKHSVIKVLYTRLKSSRLHIDKLNSPSKLASKSSSFQFDSIPLHSIMSFEECAANIALYREKAIQAINSIQQLRGEFCFAETMQLVTDYLHQEYKDGNIIGGRLICSICRVSENPSINPFADYLFPPKTEQDASNRLSSSNSAYSQIVRVFFSSEVERATLRSGSVGRHHQQHLG